MKRKGSNALYGDLFYQQIPDEEKIYVPINLLESKHSDGYLSLGLKLQHIGENYAIIHDTKKNIEEVGAVLKSYVSPNFMLPVLTPAPIGETTTMQPVKPQQMGSSPYSGKGVYLGRITTTGVNYTKEIYKKPDGTTRIALMWVQDEGGEGTYYTKEQINEALKSEDPNSMVPVFKGLERVDLMVQLSGTHVQPSYGVATNAEFIIVVLKPASPILQEIYGGTYNDSAVLYPDILISIGIMVRFASYENKPIVIFMPYLTNIGPHDGTDIYDILMRLFARQQGCTIIMPSGEEGNKAHHKTLIKGVERTTPVSLVAQEAGQNLIGLFMAKNLMALEINLELIVGDKKEQIRLDEQGITRIGHTTVYANGLQSDYGNGNWRILFRISNLPKGEWKITLLQEESYNGRCDLWLAQTPVNANVTLVPSDPFMTVGSPAANPEVITIGNFDTETMVVSGASGRGYTWDEFVVPQLVAQGVIPNITDPHSTFVLEGTGISASLVVGMIAMLYEKWVKEKGMPYPNSLVILSYLLSSVLQYEGKVYPNPGDGYGLLEISSSDEFFWIPFT